MAMARKEKQNRGEANLGFEVYLWASADKLRVTVHKLSNSLKSNVTVDWARRDSARACMRVLVKRSLRKFGYPPDLQDQVVLTVPRQSELLSENWAV